MVCFAGPLEAFYSLFIIKFVYSYLQVSAQIILALGSLASFLAIVINWNFDEEIDFENMNERGLLINPSRKSPVEENYKRVE